MSATKEIAETKMRPSIPNMDCDRCGECCGPAACTPIEFKAIKAYAARKHIIPIKQGSTCPWYQGTGCLVYPVRPFICRLYGHTTQLVCPNGHNVNIPRTAVVRLSIRLPKEDDYLWIHQCCYSEEELTPIIEAFGRKMVGNPLANITVRMPSDLQQ